MVTVDIIHGVAVLKIQSKQSNSYTKSKSHKTHSELGALLF